VAGCLSEFARARVQLHRLSVLFLPVKGLKDCLASNVSAGNITLRIL
jgi:hypothetical protein